MNVSKMLNASLFVRKFFLKIERAALRISFGHNMSTPITRGYISIMN